MPPPNQAFRGASLYSGIFDTAEPSQPPQQDPSPSQASTSTSQAARSGSSSSTTKDASSGTAATASDAAGPPKTSGWSAALRFAPRRTTAAAKAKPRPNAAFVASFAPATTADADTVEAPKGALSRAPGVAPKASSSTTSATEPVAPTTEGEVSSANTDPTPARTLAGLVTADLNLTALALPQSDTDDEWLLSQLEKYPVTEPPPFTLPPEEIERDKALARKAAEARGETRYSSHYDDVDGGEDEDADVNGFFSTSAGKRAARKKKKRKRGTSPPAGPNMNAEYDPRIPNDYMAYKQLVYDRRRAELEFQQWQQEQEEGWEEEEEERHNNEDMEETMRFNQPSTLTSVRGQSNDLHKESATPSRAVQGSTGEEAYARRVALSAVPSTSSDAVAAAAPASGEEAYQRRVAMTHAATGEEAYLRRLGMSQASPPGPPPGPPPDALTARQSAAAAIAARLGSLQPCAAMSSSDPTTFATRLMASYGHVPGHGLGASLHGMVEPLTVAATRGRGRIIDAAQTAHTHSDAQRYGSAAASRVIVLLNMPPDAHAQHDLVDDVKHECAKFGIVQRVFVHRCEGEGVRVFVQFTGEAGSWKAVRNLQGRWFEGRQLQALYYDAAAFERSCFDLPLRPSSDT
ncbi:uncharacterized protein SRS1_15472 [Sporisorium reilianum f. sp. reilianum]|uniref:G-patch domain-containing protein n=1 Tax=Sporisorium reilianum f. sp. reilianum TaxID=72559 RepID=A0A2N8UI90_9BASI|nr:uncharacterized protein SRS1_15472 [Sporisorium reilianum f. sp. reilianum]